MTPDERAKLIAAVQCLLPPGHHDCGSSVLECGAYTLQADVLAIFQAADDGARMSDPAGIQAHAELKQLVAVVRFTPGQASGHLHSEYDAVELLWR